MADLAILLATYNNEQHVAQMIDSILNQSFCAFDLYIRDDCSTDKTYEIVSQMKDERIHLVRNEKQSGSAQNNFFQLLLNCNSEYIMFADADDFWLPDKVERTFGKMKRLEWDFGKNDPILIHGNVSVTDENLNIIAKSLFDYEKLSPNRNSLRNLLCQNNVTGCTVMINRALRNMVSEKPENVVMHDWWLALVAAAFGHIGVINQPLMLYRQHGDNSVGAYNANDPILAAKKLGKKEHMRKIYDSMFLQATCFAQTYQDRLTYDQYETCMKYGQLIDKNRFAKILSIVANGFYKNTLLRNIGQFFVI